MPAKRRQNSAETRDHITEEWLHREIKMHFTITMKVMIVIMMMRIMKVMKVIVAAK